MDKNFHKDLMILSGHTYNNGNFNIPTNWSKINTYCNNNGFQATVYQKGSDIVISYRGTDTPKDFIRSDIPMLTNFRPEQYQNANKVYQQIKQSYPNYNITVTGHSLGGSLAQLVSAENGCPAVTFNAFGTGKILKDLGYDNLNNLNIINYGNPNDIIFKSNCIQQPGQTFITNTNFNNNNELIWSKPQEDQTYPDLKNHTIEKMGDLEDAVEITNVINNTPIFQLYAEKTFTREEIAQMSNDEFVKNEQQIIAQLKAGQIKEENPDYSKFINPVSGTKKIYTKEELSKMTPDEFMIFIEK